jgi:hypothetical protein
MAISVFPAPVTSSINASSITATAANTMYAALLALEPSIYTITCASSTIAKLEFYSGVNTLITSTETVSGTVTINLASTADRVRLWTDTGSSIVVTITKTAAALTNNFSGTLDTVTTVGSSTYTGTSTSGYGYAILSGGGGSGGGSTGSARAGGGGAGGLAEKLVQLTGSMAVVIGAAGTAPALNTNGNAGGQSTFAGMTCNGGSGGGGAGSTAGSAGGSATGGTYNQTGAGGNNSGGGAGGEGGNAPTPNYKFVATTIGTGGTASGNSPSPGNTGTGFGAGGSGGGFNGSGAAGGAGRPGILYVLRF